MLQKKLVRVISSKKLVIFFCRRFSSIKNSSISSGKQYLSKREVRRLSMAINIIPPPLSFLFLFLSNWIWFKARLKFQLIKISNTESRRASFCFWSPDHIRISLFLKLDSLLNWWIPLYLYVDHIHLHMIRHWFHDKCNPNRWNLCLDCKYFIFSIKTISWLIALSATSSRGDLSVSSKVISDPDLISAWLLSLCVLLVLKSELNLLRQFLCFRWCHKSFLLD